GAGAVAELGTAAQREQWAEPAGRGAVMLTAALAEEDGDDPRVPSARAERADGQWVLTGMKTAVDAAPEAGLFLVPCASPAGVLVFLVAPSDAGVRVEPQRLTDFASAGRVVLSGGALGDDRVLGGAGVAHTAVHVHGGMGIDVSYPVHRFFVAAKQHEFALGGATTQLLRIGGALAG